MALAVALRHVAGTPFGQDGAAALAQGALRAMSKDDAEAARDLAARVYLVGGAEPPPVPVVITDALAAGRVLRIGYADRHGLVTRRDIEPLGYVGMAERWYLLAWVPASARRSARSAPTGSPRSPSPRRVPAPRPLRRRRTWTFPQTSCGASPWTDRRGRAVADAAPDGLISRAPGGMVNTSKWWPAVSSKWANVIPPGVTCGARLTLPPAAWTRRQVLGDIRDQHAEHRVAGQFAAGVEQAAPRAAPGRRRP